MLGNAGVLIFILALFFFVRPKVSRAASVLLFIAMLVGAAMFIASPPRTNVWVDDPNSVRFRSLSSYEMGVISRSVRHGVVG